MTKQQRTQKVLQRLERSHRKRKTGLSGWQTEWQFLLSVIMSAQTTDDNVNKVTPTLFSKYNTLEKLAKAKPHEVEKIIRSVGFYKVKAKYVIQATKMLLKEHGGKIPNKMSELIKLPGVGRKTANVYQGVINGKSEGIAVDTHVARLSNRLGFTKSKSPEKIEQDLMKLFNKRIWHRVNPILFFHGREVCKARRPECDRCVLSDICPSVFKI